MRLSDLMGLEVRDENGASAGRITAVRFEQAPPVAPATRRPSWRLSGLVVRGGGFAYRLGYVQEEVRGPRLLAALIRRVTKKGRYVRWDQVGQIGDSAIVLRGRIEDLDDVSKVERAT